MIGDSTSRATAPIFVIGYMRSGTTLLHSVLAASEVILPSNGETKFFEWMPMWRRLYPDLHDTETRDSLILTTADIILNRRAKQVRGAVPGYRPAEFALDAAAMDAIRAALPDPVTYGGTFKAVFDYLAQDAGKTRWLEKTPQHTYFIDAILRHVPDALFVEIVRDPRAVLASKKRREQVVHTSGKFTDEERERLRRERVYDPLLDTLAWRLAVRAGRAAAVQHPDRIYTIQYERLIVEPEATIRALCNFLALPFTAAMLNVKWMSTGEQVRAGHTGFQTGSLARWRDDLGAAEIALCQRLTRAEMAHFDYAPDAVSVWGRAMQPVLYGRAAWETVRRLYKRWRLGGRGYMMNTVTNYLRAARQMVSRRNN